MIENLIEFLSKVGEKKLAINLLEVLYKHSKTFEQLDEIAKCFFKLKEYLKSAEVTKKAYDHCTTYEASFVTRQNLINVYNHANLPELALELIEVQKNFSPNDVDNKLEEAYSYFLLNEMGKAEFILTDVLENSKNLSEEYKTKIKFNLGTYNLYRDEFQKGLRLFLLEGKKLKYWQKSELPFKPWEGEDISGKTLILFAEAGIGDEIINVRFMKHLKEKGINPIWLTDRINISDIFNRNGFKSITNRKEIPAGENILWTHPMQLPIYLNLEYKDLWDGPYLKSSEEYDKKFEFINSKKLKIGVRWQGNKEYDQDLHRSLPLKDLYHILKDIDADFYSLQKDDGIEELPNFPGIIDLETKMETFEDTLSILNKMDIVITSCTSIAHASAAMGKKTFVIIPISAYYTWSHSTKQSPWYGDNVILIRQKRPREWKEPLQELKRYLINYE